MEAPVLHRSPCFKIPLIYNDEYPPLVDPHFIKTYYYFNLIEKIKFVAVNYEIKSLDTSKSTVGPSIFVGQYQAHANVEKIFNAKLSNYLSIVY